MLGVVVLGVVVAPAESRACAMADMGEATIAAEDGFASLRLDDGREIRLADIVPATTATAAAAVAESGAAMLAPFVGAAVTVSAVDDAAEGGDRYGRILGDVALKATGEPLSRRLVAQGLALVDPAVMSEPCLDALFAAEREAEQSRRGVWADAGPVRSADDPGLAGEAGRYVLVGGVVSGIGETRRTLYLNFGADYRTDFTGLVRREDAKGWADTLKALEGRTVRIRGVLQSWNGGLIRVEHLRQIELLPAGRPG